MDLDLSVCTWSGYDKAGFLGIQADAYTTGTRGMTPFHHLSPLGLDARPVDPKKEVGALCWRVFDAKEGFLFPLNDVRSEAALPNLNKGATRVFDTGTYGGFPYHFTCTLDPETGTATIESHRAGGKIILKDKEGVTFTIEGTKVTITGATSVEAGGTMTVALSDLVDTALSALQQAIAAAATTETNSSGMGGMTALNTALSAVNWPTPVAATITKGA